jgi:mRNA interferase MazF
VSYPFGAIVLTRFPFTDISGSKLRPALVLSRDNHRRSDVVLAFITSNARLATSPDALEIRPSATSGLKITSYVRFDKLATLETSVIAGQLGNADLTFLKAARPVFDTVFGFER